MVPIGSVKPVIAVGPTGHEARGAEFTQLVLDGGQSEVGQATQLAHIVLLPWGDKEHLQYFGADFRKQYIQNSTF